MKILVVEDSHDVRLLLTLELAARGYDVTAAENGVHALGLLDRERPSVMIADLGLPDMDGLQLLRLARADGGHRTTRAVAMSGFGRSREIEAAWAAGYDAVLIKPVRIQDVVATIERVSNAHAQQPVMSRHEIHP